MIIKLAFDPISLATGAGAAYAGKAMGSAVNTAISNQLHDIPNFISSKANKFGKFIQRSTLADTIIAAKKGTEGKVWANRKLLPSLFFGNQEGKTIAMMEANTVARNTPGLKHLFKGNKLQVNRVKGVLGAARAVDRGALTAQIAVPTFMGGHAFKNEYDKSGNMKKATRKGLIGAATGGLIAGGLEIPRRLAGGASHLHGVLSKNKGYGYKLLEEASHSAEKSMNRPGILNYSKRFYSTPESNLKAPTGRIFGNGLRKLMGQSTVKKFDPIKGYVHGDEKPASGILSRTLDKADDLKKRTLHSIAVTI